MTESCGFCGKTQAQVKKLITGTGPFAKARVCDECVGLCLTIIGIEDRPLFDQLVKEAKPTDYPHHHEVARGRTSKKNLVIGDLKAHYVAVNALHERLRLFRCEKLPAHIAEFYPQNIGPLTGQD